MKMVNVINDSSGGVAPSSSIERGKRKRGEREEEALCTAMPFVLGNGCTQHEPLPEHLRSLRLNGENWATFNVFIVPDTD